MNRSDSDKTKHMLEAAVGATAELAKQGGLMQTSLRQSVYQASTQPGMGQVGAMAARAVVTAAPVVAAGAVVAAPVVIAATVVGGVAYSGYKLVKWLWDA